MESRPLIQSTHNCLVCAKKAPQHYPDISKLSLTSGGHCLRLTSDDSQPPHLKPDEIRALKKLISHAIAGSTQYTPRQDSFTSPKELPTTPRTTTLLGEISHELRAVLTRRLITALQDFISAPISEPIDVKDLEIAQPLPLPLYRPKMSAEPGVLSFIATIAGGLLAGISIFSSVSALGNKLEFLIQIYLSLFGGTIMFLEGSYLPGHTKLNTFAEEWCKALSFSVGKGLIYSFVATLSLSLWQRSVLNLVAGCILIIVSFCRLRTLW